MHTARLLAYSGGLVCLGGPHPGGLPRGVCPTPPKVSLRGAGGGLPREGSAQPQVCLLGVCIRGGSAQPPPRSAYRGVCIQAGGLADLLPPWTKWHTCVKTLPCPKLRLRAVTKYRFIQNRPCDFAFRTIYPVMYLGFGLVKMYENQVNVC